MVNIVDGRSDIVAHLMSDIGNFGPFKAFV